MGLTCSVVVLLGGSHVLGSCVVGWVSRALVVVLLGGSRVCGLLCCRVGRAR